MITVDKNEQYALININAENVDEILTKDIEKNISGLFRGGYGNFIKLNGLCARSRLLEII